MKKDPNDPMWAKLYEIEERAKRIENIKNQIKNKLSSDPEELVYTNHVSIKKPYTSEHYEAALHNLAGWIEHHKKELLGVCVQDRKDEYIIYTACK